MNVKYLVVVLAGCFMFASTAQGAFIVEAHSSGLANATNFSYGGDTTTASASIVSTAVGLTASNSIFGGDGVNLPDTYVFSYTPGTDADNYSPAAGTVLGSTDGSPGEGNLASGIAGGASGLYNVYITTPATGNSNAAGSKFTLTQNGASIVIDPVDMNSGGTGPDTQITAGGAFVGGANNAWHLLGMVNLTAGNTYQVIQEANVNSFVSQRMHGVMWEAAIPEPSSMVLIGLGTLALGLIATRRK